MPSTTSTVIVSENTSNGAAKKNGQAKADGAIAKRAHYAPPWADVSIIGIAGSSGSGKSTLSQAIVQKLNLPWVVILSIDSFYKSLDEEASRKAFRCEYDFDAPDVSPPRRCKNVGKKGVLIIPRLWISMS